MLAELETIDLFNKEQGSGTELMLLHGLGLSHSIWLPLAGHCSHSVRSIIPDLRGHGFSDSPGGIYTMGAMADDVKRLLDKLRIEKILLAGHSMGGYVALAFAKKHPELLNGLILVTTNADEDPPDKKQARVSLSKEIEQRGSVALADSLASRLTDDPTLISKMHDLISRNMPKGLIGASLGMAERKDMHQTLRSLTCPILIIAGERDKITTLETTKDLLSACQCGELAVIPNAGHITMLEEPGVMSKIILTFMMKNKLSGIR